MKAYEALLDSDSPPQFSCPTSGQITNFKSREKQAKGHGIVVTTENLRQWFNEPEFDKDDPDVDLPFVLFHRVVDDGAAGAPEYHVGITTKRLLSMVRRGEEVGIQIHSDTAHKLASAAIPQFFFGFSDRARQFHPIIFAIATSETGVDFGMFFKAWQDFSDPPLTPAFSMSDAAEAIPNGAREIWGDINIRTSSTGAI